MLQKDPSWWKSCKQPLKDASKTTFSLGWWEFIWDAPVWAQETMSFRTSTGGTLFPLPPKRSWLIAAGLWAPRSSSQHSCFKGGDENYSAWVGLLGLEKKRAAMCRMTYEDFLMKGWLLGAMVHLWLHSPWVTPGCAYAWAEGGKRWILHQDLARWGLHWCTNMLGGILDPSFGRIPHSLPLDVRKLWWSF